MHSLLHLKYFCLINVVLPCCLNSARCVITTNYRLNEWTSLLGCVSSVRAELAPCFSQKPSLFYMLALINLMITG